MSQEQLTALAGKIDRIYGSRGIQPRLHFGVTITNKNAVPFEILSVRASLYVEFHDSADASASQLGHYLGDLVIDNFSGNPVIQPGDQNFWTLYLPFPLPLFSELEQARESKNLSFQINVLLRRARTR
jgi:hypothetical protein